MEEVEVDKKYSDYISKIIKQILKIIPDDINDLQRNYLSSNLKRSANLMAKSIKENEEFKKVKFENQCFFIQLIIEWSFHKEIDLFRSGIPAKYWKQIMEKIWYSMWEVMFACVKNDATPEVIINLTERFVNRSYKEAVEELKVENLIDDTIEEKAMGQSNITLMAVQLKTKQDIKKKVIYIIKMFLIFIILAVLVAFIILKFKTIGTISVFIIMILYLLFSQKIS